MGEALNIITKYMTRNDCYNEGRKLTPKGIMVHSTATPGVMAARWFDLWNKSYKAKEIDRQVCVHAFVDDKEVYQYLPWTMRGWHGGKTAANDNYIGIEICEPKSLEDKVYFDKAYKNAVELAAMLCQMFNLTEKNIIGHYEGYKMGIASNHSDPGHWFPKHGKSMDTFRDDVRKVLKGGDLPLFKRVLKHGMEGEDVGQAQRLLKALGYYKGPIDNKFGPGTGFLNAVKAFQKANGLEDDGVIGPKTQAKMLEIMLQRVEQPIEDTKELTRLQAELEAEQAKTIALQAEVSSLKNRIRKHEDYFRLQNELSKGV